MDKKTIEVSIADQMYRLKTGQDEAIVRELVGLVDQRIRQALSATKSGSVQHASVLAALNIAEELVLLKKKAAREIDLIEERAQRLAQDLERFSETAKPSKSAVSAEP